MTSCSPDAITISIAFLFIAYTLKLSLQEDKIKIIELVVLTILGIILSLCKIVYLPIILLIFIIPKEKFKSLKIKLILLVCILIVCTLINLTWLNIASKYLVGYKNNKSASQVEYILNNPVEYIKILVYTINQNFDNYIVSMVGNSLTWSGRVSISTITVYFLLGCFIISNIFEKRKEWSNSQMFVCICGSVLTVLLIFTSLYVQWTAKNKYIIDGVQGRYFIPILPLSIIISTKLFQVEKFNNEKIIKIIGVIGMITSLDVIFNLLIQFI